MQHNVSENLIQKTDELFPEKNALHAGILLQLFLTHGMISATILALVFLFPHLESNPSMSIIGAIVISGGLGLFLTANIVYDLHHVERTITDIYRGHPATFPTFSWPLRQLFTRLTALDRRVQMYIQEVKATSEMRHQYLQQASESATRTERQRIARDLHDTIKQQLFSINVSAATAKAYWSKDSSKAQAAITDIQQVITEAQVEMQALLQQLDSTPLENTKLADALRTQAEALKYRSGLEMNLTIGDLPTDDLLPEGTQEMIFRLVQEAFANIARHARATIVKVTLQQSERALHLMVSDNGKGFDTNTARAGMGLTNMRERVTTLNGSIEIQSAPGQGTIIHIAVPFLLPQSSVADKTWSERELKHAMEQTISGFQLGRTAQHIALFFTASNTSNFIVQIPTIAIAICLIIAVYGLWQGHTWKERLMPHLGKESVDGLRLQQREEQVELFLLFFLPFAGRSFLASQKDWAGIYFLASQKDWAGIYFIACLGVLSMLSIAFQLLLMWRLYRRQGHIYRVMARDELQREITDQRRTIIRDARLLLTALLATVLFAGQFVSSHLPSSTVHWGIFLLIVCFFIGCCILLRNLIVLWRQRRALGREQQKVSLSSLWRGE